MPEKYCNWYLKLSSASIKYHLKHNHGPSFYKKSSTMICIILIEQTTHKINFFYKGNAFILSFPRMCPIKLPNIKCQVCKVNKGNKRNIFNSEIP